MKCWTIRPAQRTSHARPPPRAASVAVLLATALVAVGVDASLLLDAARHDARRHDGDAAVLEAQRVRVLRENEASGRVAARVIAGNPSLAAAADELEPVVRERPGFECAWPDESFPTFRHRVARYVVTRVAADLTGDAVRRAAVLSRLDAEYAALQ